MFVWKTAFLILVLGYAQAASDYAEVDFIENVVGAVEDRIVSGWAAYPGQHPHQVNLRMVSAVGGVSSCGGSVVSRQWVLTAAHCTAQRITFVVRAGLTSLTKPEFIIEATEYYNYPTYNNDAPGTVQPDDISIMKLQRPVSYSHLVQPIRIQPAADSYRNYENEVMHASGFGATWTSGASTENLNWVYLRGIGNPSCATTFGAAIVTDNTICARFYNETSQSTCQGDSGGPLVYVDADGEKTLVGVTSFVAGGTLGCHSGLPAGFIRPGPFHGWLTEITGIDFENLEEELEPEPEPEPEEEESEEEESEEESEEENEESEEDTEEDSEDQDLEEADDSDESDEDKKELGNLMKRLEVSVKVKVKLNKLKKAKKAKKIKKKVVKKMKQNRN